jgi:pimeloyl-ACP methyl ester carboxylesterase
MNFFRSEGILRTNNYFRYNILIPEGAGKGAIILLHGLNERSWNKYLQWGIRLASDTGRPVIFFPIAYHMNRSPRSWFDRHAMMPAVAARVTQEPATRLSSFVNVALSTRMSVSPQRFFLSGYQTVNDLADMIALITKGAHPDIDPEGPVDIFAYSIGAMIAQVLMLSRSSLLPESSRLFLFCGGSTLNTMNGTSKLIMDSRAFDGLIDYYVNDFEERRERGGDWIISTITDTPAGEAFFAMSSLPRLNRLFGSPFRNTRGRLKAVTLSGDVVIPPAAVSATLEGADMELWHADYPLTHENPFPVLTGELSSGVDNTFERLFFKASSFFS